MKTSVSFILLGLLANSYCYTWTVIRYTDDSASVTFEGDPKPFHIDANIQTQITDFIYNFFITPTFSQHHFPEGDWKAHLLGADFKRYPLIINHLQNPNFKDQIFSFVAALLAKAARKNYLTMSAPLMHRPSSDSKPTLCMHCNLNSHIATAEEWFYIKFTVKYTHCWVKILNATINLCAYHEPLLPPHKLADSIGICLIQRLLFPLIYNRDPWRHIMIQTLGEVFGSHYAVE